MFLTSEQLQELTGYRQAAAQVRWLRKNGVAHYVRSDGKPKVHEDAVRPKGISAAAPKGPNFAALGPRQ